MRCCYYNYLNPYNLCRHLWATRFIALLLEGSHEVHGCHHTISPPRNIPLNIKLTL